MWRYRYVGSNNEKWFTTGEANNLANDDYVQSLPDLAVTGDLQDVAENRTWEGHQTDTLMDTMTESHMLDWKNRWNMTIQERGQSNIENNNDNFSPDQILSFGISERDQMIENILNRVI